MKLNFKKMPQANKIDKVPDQTDTQETSSFMGALWNLLGIRIEFSYFGSSPKWQKITNSWPLYSPAQNFAGHTAPVQAVRGPFVKVPNNRPWATTSPVVYNERSSKKWKLVSMNKKCWSGPIPARWGPILNLRWQVSSICQKSGPRSKNIR